jgi:hypothetical protein
VKAPRVTLDQIEQEIDLSEFFEGIDFSRAPELKASITQALIDKIVSRTEAGDGMKFSASGQGRPTKLKSPYSDAYENSLEFQAAGKSKTEINMTLTGDMLASLTDGGGKGNKIKISVLEDQVPKAYNHIVGDTVPERPWFGVSKDEVEETLADYADEIFNMREDTDSKKLRLIDFINEDDE